MEKVLIVDDHEGVREALTVLFEIEGIPALAVDSPAAALRVIRSQPIGVVVQDMNFSRNASWIRTAWRPRPAKVQIRRRIR